MDLRTNPPGHNVLDVADFVEETPRRQFLDRSACMASQCRVDDQRQLFTSGVSSGNSSEARCRFAALGALHACKAGIAKNLFDLDENNARTIVKKSHVDWGHSSASRIERILTDADDVDANVLKVVDPVADFVPFARLVSKRRVFRSLARPRFRPPRSMYRSTSSSRTI